MAHYNKEELLKRAAPYFKMGKKSMFATSDGNFFYPEDKHHAINHHRSSKTELHELVSDEVEKEVEVFDINTANEELVNLNAELESANAAWESAQPKQKGAAKAKCTKIQGKIDLLQAEIDKNTPN